MQQLDGLDIAGSQISVKIAPLTPAETQAAAAAAAGLDLDDAEGALSHTPCPSGASRISRLLSTPFLGKHPFQPLAPSLSNQLDVQENTEG